MRRLLVGLLAGALLAGCGSTPQDGSAPAPGHDANGGYLPGAVGQKAYCAENNWVYVAATNTCRVR